MFDFDNWQSASQWLYEWMPKKGYDEEDVMDCMNELEMTGRTGYWRIVTQKK